MRKICLVAVDIRSTHNVGAFFRTAEGFGADVALVGITPRPLGGSHENRLPHIAQKAHKAISKTALGAEESVSWQYYDTAEAAFKALRTEGYSIAAIEQDPSSKAMQDMQRSKNIALVMGPEVDGLPKHIVDACDEVYEIPMVGKKESYNVSVAAGIALYQASII